MKQKMNGYPSLLHALTDMLLSEDAPEDWVDAELREAERDRGR